MAKAIEELSETAIATVKDQWSKLKETPRYEKKAGTVLFKNLFQICPEAQELFGFSLKMYPDVNELVGSRRFLMHATFLIEMIDSTITILGSDESNEKLKLTLAEVGKKHATYGVKEDMFPFMTDSIVVMMRKILSDEFTEANEGEWREVFDGLIVEIVAAQKKIALEEAAKNKAAVVKTWEAFGEDNFRAGGVVLFQHLFKICPESKPLFGFPQDIDPQSEALLKSKRFMTHSFFLVNMIDKTVNLLGVDNETLSSTLKDLGQTHVTYGVKPEHLPKMTEAIIYMLNDQLGDGFTSADAKAWRGLMSALIGDMVKGQRRLQKGLAAVNKADVLKSWRLLAELKNYEEHCGVILFKHLFTKLPQAKPLFGFPLGMDVNEMSGSSRFVTHASFLIGMIEKALNMLGEDDEELTKLMMGLGEKHIRYGVQPNYFHFMTESIIAMMKETLTIKFTDKDQFAWEEVLKALISDMTKAQREHAMKKEAEQMAAAVNA